MKTRILLFAMVLCAMITACESEDEAGYVRHTTYDGAYFFNFGNWGKGGAGITKYEQQINRTTNEYFRNQNNGNRIGSNIQHAYTHNGTVYMVGNNPDQLIRTDLLMTQTYDGVTEGLISPRHSIGKGDYLYISCWGDNVDYNEMLSSYVAKYDTKTNEVVEKIMIPGGTEGLAIANNKLYVALNYKTKIVEIDLNNTSATPVYHNMPAVSTYILTDNNENLYIGLVSSYSNPTDQAGLGYFNTSTNELTVHALPGISSSYASTMYPNNDFSKIYVLATVGGLDKDGNWVNTGTIEQFDVASGEFSTFLSNQGSVNGISVDPTNGNIYTFGASSAVENGAAKIYQPDGTFVKEMKTGVSPYWSLFL